MFHTAILSFQNWIFYINLNIRKTKIKLGLFVKHVPFMLYSSMHYGCNSIFHIVVGWYLEWGLLLEAVVEAVEETMDVVELLVSVSLSIEGLIKKRVGESMLVSDRKRALEGTKLSLRRLTWDKWCRPFLIAYLLFMINIEHISQNMSIDPGLGALKRIDIDPLYLLKWRTFQDPRSSPLTGRVLDMWPNIGLLPLTGFLPCKTLTIMLKRDFLLPI